MVADVQKGEGFIGMTLLKDGWEQDYAAAPPIHRVGCVGKLTSVQLLADGRSNIMLEGLQRFEIHCEIDCKAYRQARISLLKGPSPTDMLSTEIRRQLSKVVHEYLNSHHGGKFWDRLSQQFLHHDRDEQLLNILSSWIEFTPTEKQFLLESATLLQHARRLMELIQLNPMPRPQPTHTPRWG